MIRPIPRPSRSPGRALAVVLALAGLGVLGEPRPAPGDAATPRELGRVHWERDLEAGLDRARESGRPVFLLFQEVPGCATCVGFGQTALSHPLVVEAIETAFVPVAVYNNEGGADARALARFGEPAWNNPVVRFVDAEGRDWIPRRDRIYHRSQLVPRMAAALRAAERPVPSALEWLIDEATLAEAPRATFATHCFWEGEACLGADPAVRATRASWQDGREVVEVWYDAERTSYAALLERARAAGCADAAVVADAQEEEIAREVFGRRVVRSVDRVRVASESDQKRHLSASALGGFVLTPLQQARINAALAAGGDPRPWLSPRQRERAGL